MSIKFKVSVKDFVDSFLTAALNHIISLSHLIENSNLTGLFAQVSNHESLVFPPGVFERFRVPAAIRHKWWNMQVSSLRAVVPKHVGDGAHGHFWSEGFDVEPVGDVGAGSFDDWLTQRTSNIRLHKLSQIHYLLEETDPTVISRAML